ncbi:AMP-binding protein [Corynebacterium kroppenstedtii]|uniref:o-succinylbenzoate--CoA ligase n=1 Tax=Corynebacterium pseudokroppenstedtii TaxID=2804917 RepID=UPI00194EFEBC|nr:o-succinylbenzoate--CoA ligase [Corynebacterium pseudokroppenstedtii]MDK7146801.1 o-succinylbenzoate--CoA ligase [Corynebacterium pseudokroppenstedtii]QRP14211.1 AMP-binding protein [Corynebacterium kroppenstedtii]
MNTRPLVPLPIPANTTVAELYPQLEQALRGKTSLLPLPANDQRRAELLHDVMRAGEPIDAAIAFILSTSGSTGIPKGAQLSATALATSASATEQVLGGPGQWLLALPPDHVAGLQVLLRSLAAGYEPVLMNVTQPFTPSAFVDAIHHMTGPRRYCSLVPTQVRRLIQALEPEGETGSYSPATIIETVGSLDGILVGGAPLSPALRQACVDLGWAVITTYGSSETAGGMVYDGTPLPGTSVKIQPLGTGDEGRVFLGGPTLAAGYRNADDLFGSSAQAASSDEREGKTKPFVDGWFVTDDIGTIRNGKLEILGRYDQAINTGGLKVLPEVVESAARRAGYADCAVLGIPSAEWGESVCLVIERPRESAPHFLDCEATQRIRAQLDLPSYALPTSIAVIRQIPLRGPGKTDRHALRRILSSAHHG